MRKALNIVFAGLLALLVFACTDEKAVFKKAEVTTPPVLVSVTASSNLVVNYTPAVFERSFNEKMPVYHTLGLLAIDDEPINQTLSAAKDNGTTLTITGKNLTNALIAHGLEYGQTVTLKVVVRASIQDPSKGVTNGYVDSEPAEASWKLEAPIGGADPYEGWEPSTWGVTGAIASAGISWDKDIAMITDGTWHVAKGVVLTASDEFKFRKDAAWTVNMGGTFTAIDAEFAVTQDGPNIKVTEDGTYDLFVNPDAGLAKVIVTGSNVVKDPYADFADPSTWGVTGAIASAGISWDKDIAMTTDGTWHVARNVELTASDEFKFRKDAGWTVNFGGALATVGEEFAVTQDGPNIKVPADGTYDLLLNPDAGLAKVVVSGEDPFGEGGGGGGATEPGYDSDANLWKKVDAANGAKYFCYLNPGWAQIPICDNVESTSIPHVSFSGSTYTITLDSSTDSRWQSQHYIFPGEAANFVALEAGSTYDLKLTLNSNTTFKGFMKFSQYIDAGPKHEGAVIWEPEADGDPSPANINFVADQDVVMEKKGITGVDTANIIFIFDFGSNPANTVIKIKDITLIKK